MSDPTNDSLERLREQVIEQLSNGYSRDFLSEGEFEDRLETATGARTHAELRSLIVDLPVAGSPNAPAVMGDSVPATSRTSFPMNPGHVANESTVIAVFSGAERRGIWDPPRTLNVISVFGGSDIDLREVRWPPEGVTVKAVAFFGGIDIVVPEGVNVVVNGAAIFGGFEGKRRKEPPIPGAPTLRVEGIAIFGGVDVKFKGR